MTLIVQNIKSELDQTKTVSLFEVQEMEGKIKWHQGMQYPACETRTGQMTSFC